MSKAKTVSWNEIKATPLVLVFGGEDFLATRSIRLLRDHLRAEAADLEVTEIDATEYVAGQIFNVTSPSLFNEPRLVIINSVERCTDPLIEDGIAYLANPTSDTVVILRHTGSSVRGKKLLDALRSSAIVTEVSCTDIPAKERPAFVAAEFRDANRKVTPGAIRALCEAFESSLAELSSACQQLVQDSKDVIDEELVDAYYGGRVEASAFKVCDLAIAGEAGEALIMLRHAISTGVDLVPLIAAFAAKIRQMAKIYRNNSITANQLGVAPWLFDKVRRETNAWTEDGLAAVVAEMARCDAAAKGAERDPDFAVERLILLIANRGLPVKSKA